MKKEFGILSHYWNGSFKKIQGWYGSRKFNGHSVIWDGGLTTGKSASKVPWYYKGGDKGDRICTGLWSLGRGNKPKVVKAPPEFIRGLPEGVPVHGELWYEDNLSMIKSIISNEYHPLWEDTKFLGFNIKPYKLWSNSFNNNNLNFNPKETEWFEDKVFQEKYRYLLHHTNIFVYQDAMLTEKDVNDLILLSTQEKWEGVMFTNPNSYYECNRSWNVLKYKPNFEIEAEIIGYKEGDSLNTYGKCGSIKCKITWDEKVLSFVGGKKEFIGKTVEFFVSGLREQERDWNYIEEYYTVGKELTFKFLNISVLGVPQSCNIYREA